MHIIVTDQRGEIHQLEALEGWRVMEIIRDWGLEIKAECGGACACATCHVIVDAEWMDRLVPASEEEENMLDMAPNAGRCSRLSCQILMRPEFDGLKLEIAKESETV